MLCQVATEALPPSSSPFHPGCCSPREEKERPPKMTVPGAQVGFAPWCSKLGVASMVPLLSPASEADNSPAAVICSQEKAAWGGRKELCAVQSTPTLLTAPQNRAHPQPSLPKELSQHPASLHLLTPSPVQPHQRGKVASGTPPSPVSGHSVPHGFTPVQFGTKTPTRAAPLLTLLCQPSPPGSHGTEMHKPNPGRHEPEMGAHGRGALISPHLHLALASL